MSLNVHIVAERTVTAKNKAGKRVTDTQVERFDAVQTPTQVSLEIAKSGNKKAAYIDYVKSCSFVEKLPIYDEDEDGFHNGHIIGWEDYDWTVNYLKEFEEWANEMEEAGFTIKFEVW